MPQALLTAKQKQQIENYLRTYSTNRKLLKLDRYEKQYFSHRLSDPPDADILNEAPLARARMFEVRHFILSLPNSDEKLFLYYHYIKSQSVDHCAELLGISRRTAFRLKQRALKVAWEGRAQGELSFGESSP